MGMLRSLSGCGIAPFRENTIARLVPPMLVLRFPNKLSTSP